MRAKILGPLVVAISGLAFAETSQGSASISFRLDFPSSNPGHYEITIAEDGHGTYSSNGQLNKDADPADPAPLPFTLSEKVRGQIFSLAQRAHYFKGKVDSGNRKIANTGVKVLTYNSESQNSQATYNYSPVAPIQQLTDIFQGLSITLEFGRRLSYFHKYQKLALDDDLKRMEEMQKGGNLGDMQAIAPILSGIANDVSVMNVSRARALRLLAK